MSAPSSPQERFVTDFWDQLKETQSVDIIQLPGRRAKAPADNTCLLGQTPLSKFDRLPGAEAFLERYGRPPHAIIRIARQSLLALVDNDSERRWHEVLDETGQFTQRLIALGHVGHRDLATLPTGQQPLELGRQWLDAKTGYDNKYASRQHAVIGAFGTSWLVQDTNSRNGTRVAAEIGTAWSPGGTLELSEALYVPEEWARDRVIDIPEPAPPNLGQPIAVGF